MSNQTIMQALKSLNLSSANITLAVVREYKRDRVSQYTVKYVPIAERLERRLRNIVLRHIENSNTVEEYSFDCPEPEADQVRTISYEETDFYRIFEQLTTLNPEEDIIENVDELIKSKAYLIILRTAEGIQVVGFKTLPENWKLKKSKGLIPLCYKENRFEDIEEENIFSISTLVDLFYYNNLLFILSKKEFERGLNFREGMINNANALYEEMREQNLFVNMDILQQKVGNNQRYLRKIATIRNLGHYKNPVYLQRLQQLSSVKSWNIQFDNGQIVITEDNLDNILTLLQNKRLHSELTEEDFDVESTKLVEG
jgi:hypothetical protein